MFCGFCIFLSKIYKNDSQSKKFFSLKTSQDGYEYVQNFMLIEDLKETFRTSAPRKMFFQKEPKLPEINCS
jgi:hypothetical protein